MYRYAPYIAMTHAIIIKPKIVKKGHNESTSSITIGTLTFIPNIPATWYQELWFDAYQNIWFVIYKYAANLCTHTKLRGRKMVETTVNLFSAELLCADENMSSTLSCFCSKINRIIYMCRMIKNLHIHMYLYTNHWTNLCQIIGLGAIDDIATWVQLFPRIG